MNLKAADGADAGAGPRRSHRWSRSAVAGVVAGVAVASLLGASPSEAIVPGPNGLIAFESSRDGNNDIYVMNPDGTIEQNLTNHPANDVFPAWSPDGTQITFASDRHETNNLDVYVMNADGTGVTQLTNSPGEDRGTSWTSDGETIVFHTARNRLATGHSFDLYTMNADGTNEQLLFPNASAGYVCGDSETGVVVFNSSGDPLGTNPANGVTSTGAPILDFEIFTVNLDGTGVRQVTSNTVLDSGPKWSPDCSMISYNSLDAGGSLDVHRINADGTGDENLTNAPGIFDAFSAWSPDGEEIVFSSNRDVNFEIYKMDADDGSNVQRLTFTRKGQADLRADWGTAPARYGPPTSKEQCKNGGFAEFQTPAFADQGACIDFYNANR
jgi:Tol biopolymer transport system component